MQLLSIHEANMIGLEPKEGGNQVQSSSSTHSACVVGLGKLGLPLALEFASNGVKTFGYDISPKRVQDINSGDCGFEEPGLTDALSSLLNSGMFRAYDSLLDATTSASHIVIVVPLDVDEQKKPDFSKIDMAVKELSKSLKKGQTVILETTVPIGTTRNRVGAALQASSSLEAGVDFHLAFSPERVSSGRMKFGFSNYPKLVGGLTEACSKSAAELYGAGFRFADAQVGQRGSGVWNMQSLEAAEFAKLAETTYRDVNLALANTFALICLEEEIDYMAIVEACNSQPYSQLHSPGIAVGGHCIPVYPHLMLHSHSGLSLIEAARAVNDNMPRVMVGKAIDLESPTSNSRSLIVGLSYRTGVKESAHSGAFQLRDALVRVGVEVELVDEMYTAEEVEARGFSPLKDHGAFNYVFINSGTEDFIHNTLATLKGDPLIVDGRRSLDPSLHSKHLRL